MTTGLLLVCRLPWGISPSASFVRLELEEEEESSIVLAGVNVLDGAEPELRPARVRLTFLHGFRAATHGYGDTGHFQPEARFDVSQLPSRGGEGPVERWQRLGHCDWSRVYEVAGSTFDGEPIAAPWRHFVVAGSELWIEIVARSARWSWVNAAPPGSADGGELAGSRA